MRTLMYPTCYRHPNIFRCEFGEECETRGEPGACTADHIDGMDPRKVKILEDDCITEGYTCTGIEAELLFLSNDFDMDIDGSGKEKGSFLHQVHGEKLLPFPVSMQMQRQHDFYHLRASEFGQRCPLAGLISKFRKDFLSQFKASELSIAGDVRHAICNSQPEGEFIHNATLKELGCESYRRETYCEREVEYVITIDKKQYIVRGHSDALLRLGKSIAILDFKRALGGAYESPKYVLQLAIYALAREQHENKLRLRAGEEIIPYGPFYLITVKRPFPPALDSTQRRPKFHATKISRNSSDNSCSTDIFARIAEEIKTRYRAQRELLEQEEISIQEYILKQQGSNICKEPKGQKRECFNIIICSYLQGLGSSLDLRDFLDPGVRFDREPDDSEAREIEERLQRKV